MKLSSRIAFVAAAAVLLPALASAQPGYMRRGGAAAEEDSGAEEAPKRRRAKPAEAEPDATHGLPGRSGTDKDSIEAYLQARLKALKQIERGQAAFGKQFGSGWEKFWSQVYEDRKQFEVRLAKQRLNLFESLASLDASFHARTIADFERLQETQVSSFEADLKRKMADYFSRLLVDMKAYGDQQEFSRADLMKQSMDAWATQKAETLRLK